MQRSQIAKLSAIPAAEFNLELTLNCGQVFHWQQSGNGYAGLMGELPAYVEQGSGELLVSTGAEQAARCYFSLDHPLGEISASFPTDPAMTAAASYCRGLRIVRQPHWECVATFITSALKQMPHIRQISHLLRQRFGKPVRFDGQEFWVYPEPERLAAAGLQALRECKLGFRARNLLGAAEMLAGGDLSLAEIGELKTDDLRRELCRLPGVGEKVANCVLLFAYERLDAFPIDVWIERVLRQIYFQRRRRVTAAKLRLFSRTYFGPYGGYAQQYLFHHARSTMPRSKEKLPVRRRT